jgi:glucosamine--fructose-6-phosphate aminotransferase (isomerizing)
MCGIMGYVGKRQDAAELVLEGLRALEYRGYDSWGVAVAVDARVRVEKRVGKIGGATTSLPSSGLALGHTRWATNGGVTEENAHPHVDCRKRVAVVHNGIVQNDAALRRLLVEKGHRILSETDTELVAHLVEDALAGEIGPDRLVAATMAAFRLLEGLNAIALLDVETGALAAAKSGSPLVVGIAESGHLVASDATALLPHTRKLAFVAEGKAVLLDGATARLFDIESHREEPLVVVDAAWSVQSADKGVHPDYMTKEMHEQPSVIERIASAESDVRRLASEIAAARDVFAIGCGSGFNAALAAEYAFAAAGRPVRAARASEFAHCVPLIGEGSLMLAFSQSGETIDVLDAARAARQRGARVLALTNVEGSSLFRFADAIVPLGVGPERCVVATKSLIAKLALVFLARSLMAGEYERGRAFLRRAGADISSILSGERRAVIRELAGVLQHCEHLYVLGRGMGHVLCLETALKIKEVSYLHAEGFAAGELKHGAIALIEKGTPCIVMAPDDETLSDVLASAAQVKARGAVVIGIGPASHAVFDHHLATADCGGATSIAIAVAGQIIGYELARLRGHDPDMPRNLAKSVTVK